MEERRLSARVKVCAALMWKSGPSGPRQRREKEEPSPVGTAEPPLGFETKRIDSIAARPSAYELKRKSEVEERPFRVASEAREKGTESRRDGRNAA